MKISKIFILLIIITAVITAVIYSFFLREQNNTPQKIPPTKISEIKEKSYVQILFVGDLMFDRGIRYYAGKNGGNNFIFEKVRPELLSNDLVVANLEGPITDNKSISTDTVAGSTNNYFFTFDPSLAKTLFENNIRIVDLGNNHILNFGRAGLTSTKKYLDDAKIGYFGASDYPRSTSTEIGGIKITLISYNEFSAVPEESKATIEEIQKAKGFSDIIIVFSHWGVEYSKTPTEEMKNLAHQFIDAGANLVIGSHPHVIESSDEYNGKKIYYSLGNFVFDQYFNEDVRNGLGVKVQIDKATKRLNFTEKRFYLDSNGQTIEKTE